MMDKKTVLIVEDNSDIGEFLTWAIIHESSYYPMHVRDIVEAWNLMQRVRPDVLVLDYTLAFITGIEFYDRLQTHTALKDIPTLIISAYPDLCCEEVEGRHLAFLKKPFDVDDFLHLLTHVPEREKQPM